MRTPTAALRKLLKNEEFLNIPVAYDALVARLIESAGFVGCYTSGFNIGAACGVPEPLLTMDETVRKSGELANAVSILVLADAGAGFGEPLHTMRTVRECPRKRKRS